MSPLLSKVHALTKVPSLKCPCFSKMSFLFSFFLPLSKLLSLSKSVLSPPPKDMKYSMFTHNDIISLSHTHTHTHIRVKQSEWGAELRLEAGIILQWKQWIQTWAGEVKVKVRSEVNEKLFTANNWWWSRWVSDLHWGGNWTSPFSPVDLVSCCCFSSFAQNDFWLSAAPTFILWSLTFFPPPSSLHISAAAEKPAPRASRGTSFWS